MTLWLYQPISDAERLQPPEAWLISFLDYYTFRGKVRMSWWAELGAA